MPEIAASDDDDEPFEYWPEAEEAIVCFIRYLSDQWIYSFGGIAALDNQQALAVIERLHQKPARQLRLLEEVKHFASGVLSYVHQK